MLSEHDVACRQTERPVITLGSPRPLSKEESPSKNSLEMVRLFWTHDVGPKTAVKVVVLFSSKGIQQELICWRVPVREEPGCRWAVLLGCAESEATSGWETQEATEPHCAEHRKHWNREEKLGVLHQWLSISESLLRSCLKGRIRELLLLCVWHQLVVTCALKVSQVAFGERGPCSTSEKHCSRVINETMGEIVGCVCRGLRIARWDPYQEGGGIKGREQMIHACREQRSDTGTETNYRQT